MNDNYIVSIDSDGSIDDNIILAVDEQGGELLRFGIPVGDKWVKCRYPTYGNWGLFKLAVKKIFLMFGAECDEIPVPSVDEFVNYRSDFKHWSLLQAAIQAQKNLTNEIDKVFFEYLRPSVDGVENTRQWIYDNAPITLPFLFFAAILHPDAWLKKKSLMILAASFQTSMSPISDDTYIRSTAGAKPQSPNVPLFDLM